jgi:hypothetical protein
VRVFEPGANRDDDLVGYVANLPKESGDSGAGS